LATFEAFCRVEKSARGSDYGRLENREYERGFCACLRWNGEVKSAIHEEKV